MITASFDLAVWTVLLFILGMINPRWPLFFLKKPTRFLVIAITMVFVMFSLTLWAEGHRREQLEKVAQKPINPITSPVPVPVPSDIPAKTK